MKKLIPVLLLLIVAPVLVMNSCVSSKKFKSSQAHVGMLQNDSINAFNELKDCNGKLLGCTDNLNIVTADKLTLQKEYGLAQNDLEELAKESKTTIADQAKRLKTLQDRIQAQKDVMTKLKNSIADALMNYNADELHVYTKNGNVYVSLEEKLLFKSGSDVVDPKGKEALKSLAKVLSAFYG